MSRQKFGTIPLDDAFDRFLRNAKTIFEFDAHQPPGDIAFAIMESELLDDERGSAYDARRPRIDDNGRVVAGNRKPRVVMDNRNLFIR